MPSLGTVTAGTGTGQPVTSYAAAAKCSPAHLSQPLAVPGINSTKALLYFGTNELLSQAFETKIFFIQMAYRWERYGQENKMQLGRKRKPEVCGRYPEIQDSLGFLTDEGDTLGT